MTGQEHILNYLKKSIEKDKVSHAYLFEGPGYFNKKDMALWFAKYLDCEGPDITEISALENKQISIEQIRELRRYLSLSPHSGSYKIAIIDSAEKMTSAAANALLKTLEEPRGNAVLILVTSVPLALPNTILSRCEEIKFRAISLDKISKDFIKQEYIDILQKPLNDIFKYIEKMRENSEILLLLDSWLFWFRDKMKQDAEYVKILKEIQKTKNLVLNTNVNKHLALENLVLCIKK